MGTRAALQLLEEAAQTNRAAPLPFGPANPMKPALELYGEVLLATDRPGEAVEQFETVLARRPRRAASLGAARGRAQLGDQAAAAGLLCGSRRCVERRGSGPCRAPRGPASQAPLRVRARIRVRAASSRPTRGSATRRHDPAGHGRPDPSRNRVSTSRSTRSQRSRRPFGQTTPTPSTASSPSSPNPKWTRGSLALR